MLLLLFVCLLVSVFVCMIDVLFVCLLACLVPCLYAGVYVWLFASLFLFVCGPACFLDFLYFVCMLMFFCSYASLCVWWLACGSFCFLACLLCILFVCSC